jgi:ubiquinone/menaquinone biosynthesis C-methylase UbiE
MSDIRMSGMRTSDIPMPDQLTKLAYQTLQQGKNTFGFVHKLLANSAMKYFAPTSLIERGATYKEEETPKVNQAVINEVRRRLEEIAIVDWQDAEQGVYPASILFDQTWDDFVVNYPRVWLDMPQTWARSNRKAFRDFDADIDTTGYPNYYTQNFHYQTGGYLSDQSAELYDLQVELLFNGGADPMRRRVLAPLKQGLTAFSDVVPKQIQILDVACGTGRTLKMIRGMLPQASLHGLDLSPAYLRKANQLLSKDAGVLPQLIQGKGEALPYRDHYFHAVTCVFLFHELPAPVRQQVINEVFRVVQPGGTFVLCDSIQLDDSPTLLPMMEGFARTFHEPFYRDYVRDDLTARLQDAGFEVVNTQMHYMSKYLVARKPIG